MKAKEIIEWFYCIIIAFIIAVVIKMFLGTPTIVKQISMEPTLKPNDRVILSRVFKDLKKLPKRYDIITFEAPLMDNVSLNPVTNENPRAVYPKEDLNIFQKFTKNVLEIKKTNFIKRVIGLPGDHIELKDEKIYLNGKELDEPYLDKSVKTIQSGALNDFIVPEGYIFAVGDNRDHSNDCRVFGCIPQQRLEGIVKIRFWPFSKFGKVD